MGPSLCESQGNIYTPFIHSSFILNKSSIRVNKIRHPIPLLLFFPIMDNIHQNLLNRCRSSINGGCHFDYIGYKRLSENKRFRNHR
jgi:hypothetical protein